MTPRGASPSGSPLQAGPAPGWWVTGTLALAVGLALTTVLAAAPATSFRDGPPPAVTGGFGEDSCYSCHWDGLNDGQGKLTVTGVPDRFVPGAPYPLRVTLSHPEMEVAGFQLSARFAEDGRQAGTLEPEEGEEERISVVTWSEVQFIQHLLPGIFLSGSETATWDVVWTAPREKGPVTFHAAAVAGDDDESQVGDVVYTLEMESRPADRLNP